MNGRNGLVFLSMIIILFSPIILLDQIKLLTNWTSSAMSPATSLTISQKLFSWKVGVVQNEISLMQAGYFEKDLNF